MIIGTAGHIDHGKTALVKALTGTDADRLAEEKRRGITIDLGYAYAGEIGFVDVPGHERFVHTMLAGAGGIDAALLVVDLTEGIMPQTREHADILHLLGIDRGIVVLTKSDRAGDRAAALEADMRALLAGTVLADAPVMPVSAVTGQGIADLAAALRTLAPRPRPVASLPRLAVDRAFTLPGTGLVVTGTLVSGQISVEDRLVLSPPNLAVRVRGLHAQNRPAETAMAGQRVALNITGPDLSKERVRRGDWVLHPAIHAPTAALDARINLLASVAGGMRSGSRVHLHLGAEHVMARLTPLDPDAGRLRLTLDRPVGALAQDRIVLRDSGAMRTLGGGIVIDPSPPRRRGRTPQRLGHLAALEQPRPADALRTLLAQSPGWTDQDTFFQARAVPEEERATCLQAAGAIGIGTLAVAPQALQALRRTVTVVLAQQHRLAPDQPGVPEERLRLLLPMRLPPTAFRAVLSHLLRERAIARNGSWLCLPAHRVMLRPQDEQAWQAMQRLLAANRFRPPRAPDLAMGIGLPDKAARAVLKRMQALGAVVEVAPDHFFLRDAVADMAGVAAEVMEAQGVVTAAALRDRLGNGRKAAIEVLEYFDRAGLTQRRGDDRLVRRDRVAAFARPQPPP
ncbi:MAG: selenocysteine-specific translation elongation factor [Acetobacteraceae bacterium]